MTKSYRCMNHQRSNRKANIDAVQIPQDHGTHNAPVWIPRERKHRRTRHSLLTKQFSRSRIYYLRARE